MQNQLKPQDSVKEYSHSFEAGIGFRSELQQEVLGPPKQIEGVKIQLFSQIQPWTSRSIEGDDCRAATRAGVTTGWHTAFPPSSEIHRGYFVTVSVNRYGHTKIPPFNAMTMSDTKKIKVNSCFSCKENEPRTSDLLRLAGHSA